MTALSDSFGVIAAHFDHLTKPQTWSSKEPTIYYDHRLSEISPPAQKIIRSIGPGVSLSSRKELITTLAAITNWAVEQIKKYGRHTNFKPIYGSLCRLERTVAFLKCEKLLGAIQRTRRILFPTRKPLSVPPLTTKTAKTDDLLGQKVEVDVVFSADHTSFKEGEYVAVKHQGIMRYGVVLPAPAEDEITYLAAYQEGRRLYIVPNPVVHVFVEPGLVMTFDCTATKAIGRIPEPSEEEEKESDEESNLLSDLLHATEDDFRRMFPTNIELRPMAGQNSRSPLLSRAD